MRDDGGPVGATCCQCNLPVIEMGHYCFEFHKGIYCCYCVVGVWPDHPQWTIPDVLQMAEIAYETHGMEMFTIDPGPMCQPISISDLKKPNAYKWN